MEIIESASVEKSGAYRMTAAEYHADPCPAPSLSSSVAKILLESTPLHAWHAHPRLNPAFVRDEGSSRLALGSVCHALLLGEGAKIHPIDADSFRSNAAKAARDAALARGELPILVAQLQLANEMVDAARPQLAKRGLAEMADGKGDCEVVVAVEDPATGAWLRIMTDWWSPDRYVVADFKTKQGYAEVSAFSRHAAEFGYDVQAAMYERVVTTAYPTLAGRLEFRFAVQEIEPPYALAVYRLSEADLSIARRMVDTAVETWAHCLSTKHWPGYPESVESLPMPTWRTTKWLERELAAGDLQGDWTLGGDR